MNRRLRKTDVEGVVVRKRSPERPSLSRVRCLSYCQLLSASDSPYGRERRSRTSTVERRDVIGGGRRDFMHGGPRCWSMRRDGTGTSRVLHAHEAQRHRSHRRRTVPIALHFKRHLESETLRSPLNSTLRKYFCAVWGATISPGNANLQSRLARSRQHSKTARRQLES